jgi:hypothetical protein
MVVEKRRGKRSRIALFRSSLLADAGKQNAIACTGVKSGKNPETVHEPSRSTGRAEEADP